MIIARGETTAEPIDIGRTKWEGEGKKARPVPDKKHITPYIINAETGLGIAYFVGSADEINELDNDKIWERSAKTMFQDYDLIQAYMAMKLLEKAPAIKQTTLEDAYEAVMPYDLGENQESKKYSLSEIYGREASSSHNYEPSEKVKQHYERLLKTFQEAGGGMAVRAHKEDLPDDKNLFAMIDACIEQGCYQVVHQLELYRDAGVIPNFRDIDERENRAASSFYDRAKKEGMTHDEQEQLRNDSRAYAEGLCSSEKNGRVAELNERIAKLEDMQNEAQADLVPG